MVTARPTGTSRRSVPAEYAVNTTRTRHLASSRTRAVVRVAQLRRFSVPTARAGCDHHARTREPCAPAQVEIFRARERVGIEAAELVEQVGAHEHGGARHVEDVAHAVVLLLVDLAGFDAGVRATQPVDRATDFEEHVGFVERHELRADDRRVGPERLFDHHADRRRVEHDIVVADEEERRALHGTEHLVRSPTEPGIATDATHERGREGRGDPGGRVVGRAGVDDQHRERRVVLGPEAGHGFLEEGAGVAGDHNGNDGRRHFRIGGNGDDGVRVGVDPADRVVGRRRGHRRRSVPGALFSQ